MRMMWMVKWMKEVCYYRRFYGAFQSGSAQVEFLSFEVYLVQVPLIPYLYYLVM